MARWLGFNQTRAAMVVVGALFGASAIACAGPKVATPADLQRMGTKNYPGHTREELVQATTTALKVLGYEIVTADPRIRTSPKAVATTAAGGYGTAQTYTEAVAWDIDVQADGQGANVHAECSASVNGQPMDQVFVKWAEPNFKQLFKEIDSNMPMKK